MGGDICTDRLKITPDILKLIAGIDELNGARKLHNLQINYITFMLFNRYDSIC